LEQIFKITPISDHLSKKDSLSVEPSRRSCGEKTKKKKETSGVKYNTSGHYRGRRYKKHVFAKKPIRSVCRLARPAAATAGMAFLFWVAFYARKCVGWALDMDGKRMEKYYE